MVVIGEVVSVSPWLCNPLKRRWSSLVLKQEPRKHFIHKWCVETEKLSCISWPQIEFYSGSTWWTTDQSHASFFNICWHLLVLASILPSFFFFFKPFPTGQRPCQACYSIVSYHCDTCSSHEFLSLCWLLVTIAHPEKYLFHFNSSLLSQLSALQTWACTKITWSVC